MIERIREKYAIDSAGAFGNEKNPMKKHQMRASLKEKNTAEFNKINEEYQKIRELAQNARNVFKMGRSWKQGPAIKKAYDDAKAAIDRLWAVVEMRGSQVAETIKR